MFMTCSSKQHQQGSRLHPEDADAEDAAQVLGRLPHHQMVVGFEDVY